MIGSTLKKIRCIYGFSALEMSRKLGISRSYLSEIENESKQPPLKILEKYSEITGLKLSSIMLLAEEYDAYSSKEDAKRITSDILNAFVDRLSRTKQ